MSSSNYLAPSKEMVLNELKKNPGKWFENGDRTLVDAGSARGYKPRTIYHALWDLEREGYIAKVRRGRRVYFYFPEGRDPDKPGSISVDVAAQITDRSLQYTVTYTKDEDGYIVASVPALPGCHSQGRTKEEARRNIHEAMRGYLASLKHRGELIPQEEVEQVEILV